MTANHEDLTLSQGTRITVSQDVLITSVNSAVLMLETNTGVYYELDEIGGRIWKLLEEHGTIDAVVDALIREFDVEAAQARIDVVRLVHELTANKLAAIHTDTIQAL